MGLTKRERELRSGWSARVSRPIAFLFAAFYHATGLKRCNNECVMWLMTESADRWKSEEAARNMLRAKVDPRPEVEIDLQ